MFQYQKPEKLTGSTGANIVEKVHRPDNGHHSHVELADELNLPRVGLCNSTRVVALASDCFFIVKHGWVGMFDECLILLLLPGPNLTVDLLGHDVKK